jgi:zinc protease
MNKLLIAVMVICMQNYQAQTLPKMIRNIEGIKEYKLENGLKVLLISDATQNNFVVNIIYHVGSRHEGYGETGMAHLLEHMLFKSCKNFTDIKKAIADRGAQANGTTWLDRTNYYEVLPASDDNLKWAIEMEADRMVNAKILKDELEKEFSVVRNEFEIGENAPSGVLQERILSTMYLWHNYGNSTIGSREDIERVPVENLRAFYRKFYQPDNATLIIAGKFDEQKALEYIVKNLGVLPRPSRVIQPTYTVEPPQDGERYVELKRNGDEKVIAMAYHTSAASDSDYIANDALVEILTSKGSGILYKELVDTKLATSVSGYSMPLYDPGFTYYSMNVPVSNTVDNAKTALFKVMDQLPNYPFTQDQLDKAKLSLKSQIDRAASNTINFGIFLTEIIASGDYRMFFLYRDHIDKLKLSDIQRVAKHYYHSSNRTWGQFIPEKNANERVRVSERPNIDLLVQNYKGKASVEQQKSFEATIDNIKSTVVNGTINSKIQYHVLTKPTKNNKVVGRMKLYIGDEKSLANKSSVASILGELLKSGTTTKNQTQIKEDLDRLKSDINIYLSGNILSVAVKSDKENLSATMDLLRDIMRNPSFSKEEFEKIILENKTTLEAYKNDPANLAFITIGNKTNPYQKGHPYYTYTLDEQIDQLNKLTIEDAKNFYTQFLGMNEGFVSFVGEADKNLIVNKVTELFAGWSANQGYTRIPHQYMNTQKNTETIQIDDKTNAVCVGGINIPISQQDKDYPALYMLNELLGGGSFLNSRIPQRLREAEGMSYGAGSSLDAEWDEAVGSISTYAFFNPSFKEKLNSALLDELTKASQGTFTEKELSDSKASLIQQRRIVLGDNDFLTRMFNQYADDKKDLKYFDEFSDKLQSVSLAEINNAAKKYLTLDKLYMLFTGDFKIKK